MDVGPNCHCTCLGELISDINFISHIIMELDGSKVSKLQLSVLRFLFSYLHSEGGWAWRRALAGIELP